MGILTSQCPLMTWQGTLSEICNISVFKYVRNTSTTIQLIYNKFMNLIENCNAAFDTTTVLLLLTISHIWCQWLAWRVWWHAFPFIIHEITWCQAKLMSFPTKIHTVMLWCQFNLEDVWGVVVTATYMCSERCGYKHTYSNRLLHFSQHMLCPQDLISQRQRANLFIWIRHSSTYRHRVGLLKFHSFSSLQRYC